MKSLLAAPGAAALVAPAEPPPSLAASLVLLGGRAWTGNPAQAGAEAVGVWGDRIVAVGTTEEIRKLRGEGTLDGKNPQGWIPRQKITVEDALRAYTRGAAFAGLDESRLGRIASGYLVNLVVLASDILTMPPEKLDQTRVQATVVGGKVVFGETR